jgi:two-component system sensor histidine kinase SenX3
VNPTAIAVLAGLIGFALGVSGLVALQMSARGRRARADVQEPVLPDGAADVLSVIGRAYVVVDGVDGVVRASPAAYAFGLVRGHTVVHEQMLEMIRRARRSGVIEERRVELGRGPFQTGTVVLDVRVAPIAEEYILLLADDQTEIGRSRSATTSSPTSPTSSRPPWARSACSPRPSRAPPRTRRRCAASRGACTRSPRA